MFIRLTTYWTEKRVQQGCSNWPQGFSGYSFYPHRWWKTATKSGSFRKNQKREVLYLETDNSPFQKNICQFHEQPPVKTNRKKKITLTSHPTKCALLTQSAVQPSLKSWGSYSTKKPARRCTHTHKHAHNRTHTGNGFTISLQTRKRPFVLFRKCYRNSLLRRNLTFQIQSNGLVHTTRWKAIGYYTICLRV